MKIIENKNSPSAAKELIASCKLPAFNFASFNSKSFSKLNSHTYMLIKRQISNSDLPEFNKYEHFYLSEYYNCSTFAVQQLVYRDESCCTYLYYLTYSKIQKKYISSKFVALTGSDANWIEKDTVFQMTNGIIKVKKFISDGIEKEDDGSIVGYNKDFITLELSVGENGLLNRRKIDSTRIKSLVVE